MIIRVLNESKVKKVNYQPLNDFLANTENYAEIPDALAEKCVALSINILHINKLNDSIISAVSHFSPYVDVIDANEVLNIHECTDKGSILVSLKRVANDLLKLAEIIDEDVDIIVFD